LTIIATIITKINNAVPAAAPITILVFLLKGAFVGGDGDTASVDGAASGGGSDPGVDDPGGVTVCDVDGVSLSKLQLNVTFDIVTLAALTSIPGLHMLIGAHGGLGVNVYTSPVRPPSMQAGLWHTMRTKSFAISLRRASSTPLRPRHAHMLGYFVDSNSDINTPS
jgi:hypothetical protein